MNHCSKCGAELEPSAEPAPCPACLLEAGLSFLPEEPKATVVTITEKPGDRIGRYKLLQQIGEGGCGVVYMAEQEEPVRRSVALKVIKLGMDTKQVMARFEAERQALALMDHPNIAKVLDAGATEAGRPYFVMELVRGIKITEFCDEKSVPTADRLRLFTQVCQAIQHAHQKGIIHRDIKPSNILVTLQDGVPVPKVIDFGIAKATCEQRLTDKTIFTAFEQFLGTPAYMSPEQAEMSGLDIDTRSDIYSLGVLLYELLTGSTPFDAKELLASGLDAMRKTIREKEPVRPSTRFATLHGDALATTAQRRSAEPSKLLHQLKGDLDWIIMRCLEKDRARRYETANGLAADLKRHMSDEPVVACPPSAGYRLRKFVRRNKALVLAAGCVLLTLGVGIIGTTLGLIEAGRQRHVVEGQRNELAEHNRALQAAHQHERLLNERARQAIETVTSETAIELFTREKELRPEQKDFLDKLIQYYAESTQDGGATEQERTRQAQAYSRMGRMNLILGRSLDSEKAYLRAVALGEQLAADFPTQPEFRQELALSYNALKSLFHTTGRLTEAESANVKALAIQKQLVADFPMRAEFRQAMAGSYNNLGNLLLDTGRPKEAEAAMAEALAIRKQLAADSPAKLHDFDRPLAMSHNNLGWLFHSTGRLTEAEAAFLDAVAFQKQAVAEFPNRPEFRLELARYQINLGNVLRDAARPKEAETLHAEALVICKQLVADFPNRPEFRLELAKYQMNLGNVLRDAARPKEAETLHAEALVICKQLVADFPNRPEFRQGLAEAHENLGNALRDTGRLKDAEAAYAEALAILKQLAADFPMVPDYSAAAAGTLLRRANAAGMRRDFAAARRLLEVAFPYHQAALEANPLHPGYRQNYRNSLLELTQSCAGQGDRSAALAAAGTRRDLGWERAADAYDAAGMLARCVPIVQKDDKIDASKRQTETQFYGDQAMAMLRDAVAKGYKNASAMKNDTDLGPLREREDFKNVVAELEAANETPSKKP